MAKPATRRMDSVAIKRGGSWVHDVELPQITAPIQGKSREVNATGKVGRKIDKEDDKTRELKLGRKEFDKQEDRA